MSKNHTNLNLWTHFIQNCSVWRLTRKTFWTSLYNYLLSYKCRFSLVVLSKMESSLRPLKRTIQFGALIGGFPLVFKNDTIEFSTIQEISFIRTDCLPKDYSKPELLSFNLYSKPNNKSIFGRQLVLGLNFRSGSWFFSL